MEAPITATNTRILRVPVEWSCFRPPSLSPALYWLFIFYSWLFLLTKWLKLIWIPEAEVCLFKKPSGKVAINACGKLLAHPGSADRPFAYLSVIIWNLKHSSRGRIRSNIASCSSASDEGTPTWLLRYSEGHISHVTSQIGCHVFEPLVLLNLMQLKNGLQNN